MNDKKNIMVTTLPDGTKEEVEVLLAFKFNDNNKEYVIYTKNEVDDNGNVTCVHAKYLEGTKSGEPNSNMKVKGTIHGVDANSAIKAECRLYENLIDEEKGVYNEDGSLNLNPNSIEVKKDCYLEEALKDAAPEDRFQFVRNGFYCVDSKDSTEGAPVFNRIVSLKSSFVLPKSE